MTAPLDLPGILNSLALSPERDDEPRSTAPKKRKPADHPGTRCSKKARMRHHSLEQPDEVNATLPPARAMPRKLGRPRRRHAASEINNLQRKSKSDTYAIPDDSPEKAVAKPTAGGFRRKGARRNTKRGVSRASKAMEGEQSTAGRIREKDSEGTPRLSSKKARKTVDGIPEPQSVMHHQLSAPSQCPMPEKRTTRKPKARTLKSHVEGAKESLKGRDVADKEELDGVSESGGSDEIDKDVVEEPVVTHESTQPTSPDAESHQHQPISKGRDTAHIADADDESSEDGLDLRPELQKALLGRDKSWEQVIEGVQALCSDALVDESCVANTMQNLITTIQEARQIYDAVISQSKSGDEALDATFDKLSECLDRIEDVINGLPQQKPRKKAGEMVRDIYINAIPQLIRLLKRAMSCRVLKSTGRAYDVEGINEIIRIQELILRLCMKVFSWDAKPATDVPITKNMKSKVFPYLRNLNDAFRTELAAEERRARIRQNRAMTVAREEQQEILRDQARDERDLSLEISIRRQREAMAAERRKFLRSPTRARYAKLDKGPDLGMPQLNTQSQRKELWTRDEDIELKRQLLLNVKANKLPCKSPCIFTSTRLTFTDSPKPRIAISRYSIRQYCRTNYRNTFGTVHYSTSLYWLKHVGRDMVKYTE
ncbi:MAG: hypothetical protein Q9217_002537 [Psora testacea]